MSAAERHGGSRRHSSYTVSADCHCPSLQYTAGYTYATCADNGRERKNILRIPKNWRRVPTESLTTRALAIEKLFKCVFENSTARPLESNAKRIYRRIREWRGEKSIRGIIVSFRVCLKLIISIAIHLIDNRKPYKIISTRRPRTHKCTYAID